MHRGALSCPAESSTGRRQCNSLEAQHQSMATAGYVPTPNSQLTKQKRRQSTQYKMTPKQRKRKRIQKGDERRGARSHLQIRPLAFHKLGLSAHGRIVCDLNRRGQELKVKYQNTDSSNQGREGTTNSSKQSSRFPSRMSFNDASLKTGRRIRISLPGALESIDPAV